MSSNHFFQSLETKKSRGLFIFLLILSALIYVRFDNVIQNLGTQKVLEAWGDGLKTYTNTMYHIDYDTKSNWFDGMNYPYGEHIVPATELPGLAMFLRGLKGIFPNISDAAVAIIHSEMLLAFLLCGVFLFLLFRALHLPFWYSMLAAIGLTFLNPTTPRMTAHFGLAQPFVLPLLLYLLLLFEKKQSLFISFLIGLTIFISSFLHFYFFGISVFFVSFYFLFRLLNQRQKEALSTTNFSQKILQSAPVTYAIRMIPPYFLMVGIPLAFFYFWMIGQDPVLDRTATPYGLLVYVSNLEGNFLSDINPINEWFMTTIITPRPTQFEGKSYVGMVAVLFVLFLIIRWIGSGFRKSFLPVTPTFHPFLRAALGMGIVLLILSMGLPFVIPPLEFLKDYVGPIKQFRSLGRFAWAFYFVINMVAFYWIYICISKQQKIWRTTGFIAVFGLLFFEAYQLSYQTKFKLNYPMYWEPGNSLSAYDAQNEALDFSQYQATIPIPYYSIGSNNFNYPTGGLIKQRVQTISVQTGIPTTGAMLTRSSRQQTFNQFQLIVEPYRIPNIFQDFKSEKPLLLAWRNNPQNDYLNLYGHLKEGAKSIFLDGELELFHVEIQDFQYRIDQKKRNIATALESDSLFTVANFLTTDSIQRFVFEDFENQPSTEIYLGKGALEGNLSKENLLFHQTLPNVTVGENYHLQCWVWVNEDQLPATLISFTEKDPQGNILQKKDFHVWPNYRTLDANGWLLMEHFFQPRAVNSKFKWTFTSLQKEERIQQFDELLIKPINTHLYRETKEYIWMDNLWFEK